MRKRKTVRGQGIWLAGTEFKPMTREQFFGRTVGEGPPLLRHLRGDVGGFTREEVARMVRDGQEAARLLGAFRWRPKAVQPDE